MSAKPTLVLVAAWCETKGEADEFAEAMILGVSDESPAASATHAAEDLDLPGMRRLLARLGLDGVVPE